MHLIDGIVAEEIDVEGHRLLHERLADPPRADDGYGLARDLIAQERQIGVPRSPAVLAHQALARVELARHAPEDQQAKLRRGFGENVGGVGEGNLVAVGVGAVDVVKAYGVLRHHFQRPTPRLENFGVDRVAQRGDEPVDAGAHLLDDQALGRRLDLVVDLDLVAAPAQEVKGVAANIAGGENPEARFAVPHEWSFDVTRRYRFFLTQPSMRSRAF